MTDLNASPTTDSAVPAAPSAEPSSSVPPATAPVPSSASPAPVAGDAGDVFADLPADQAVFDRGWVDKVRNEGRRYREQAQAATTKLGTYESVYGDVPDGDRETWFELARTWKTDPQQAAQIMAEIAKTILDESGGDAPAAAAVAATAAGDSPEAVSPDQVQKMIEEAIASRDKAAAEQRAIDNVYAEVRAGGYDPESREGFMVMWTANHETNGDIKAAVESMQKYRQSIVDEYVSGRATGNRAALAPSNGVVATGDQPVINDLNEARRATEAFLRGVPAQPG